jgi:peptide/nickel transport system substrate-binding protein
MPIPTPTPGKEMARDFMGRLVEKPKYGGWLTTADSESAQGFDEAFTSVYYTYTLMLTNEEAYIGDWAKGLSGTGEATWRTTNPGLWNVNRPCLVESWELQKPDTLIFHIRKGVHFALNPNSEASRLVGGREMNASDVAFSYNRVYNIPTAYIAMSYPDSKPISITAPDKWTVVFQCRPGTAGEVLDNFGEMTRVVPPEVVQKYGDMRDWRNSVGTGAFMLADFVPQSSSTFIRNPNYWMKDPVFPENQLPYVDGIKWLHIADIATRLAALRTGKIDFLSGLTWDNAKDLMKSGPQLKWGNSPSTIANLIYLRADTKPFDDIRARWAAAMAIDRKTIADQLYGGHATIFAWLVPPLTEYADMFTPLEKLPDSTRELWEYHPDKAKQLLVEAGYPNGFNVEIQVTAGYVDLFSVVKDYWEKVGIKLNIDVKESAVWYSIIQYGKHKNMAFRGGIITVNTLKLLAFRLGAAQNYSKITDPHVEETWAAIRDNYFDTAKRNQIIKEFNLYQLEQCWHIQLPAPDTYGFWWPWMANYHGELASGWVYDRNYQNYLWIDQELKKSMGH